MDVHLVVVEKRAGVLEAIERESRAKGVCPPDYAGRPTSALRP